jgi:hypothetical protein
MELREIEGFPQYLVREDGRVWNKRRCSWIRPVEKKNGYLQVALCYNGQTSRYCHRLVATAFLGDGNGLEVNHKDGNKRNNHYTNLEWVTHQQNMDHAKEHGLLN